MRMPDLTWVGRRVWRGEVELIGLVLGEFDPRKGSETPGIGNGMALAMSSTTASTHLWALLRTERFAVQPVVFGESMWSFDTAVKTI
jgi:hypothetical protein